MTRKHVTIRLLLVQNLDFSLIGQETKGTDALMVRSWVNGCPHSLKVPSTYQLFARAKNWSCWSVANIRLRRPRTLTSERKKPSGMWLSSNSKSRSSGSFGLSCWRFLLAARAIYSGLGKLEQGPSVI